MKLLIYLSYNLISLSSILATAIFPGNVLSKKRVLFLNFSLLLKSINLTKLSFFNSSILS